MIQAILTVVEKGHAEEVIDAAVQAGSHGGTIINARGSGVHETATLFGLGIEPEKELMIILADQAKAPQIVETIYETLELRQPGNGIVFVQNTVRVRGLYQPTE